MPVQIPSLQRIAPQASQSSGQISTNVVNTAPTTEAVTKAVSSAASQINDYQVKVQEHANDQIAQRGTNDYEIKVREALGGLRKYQGDPTAAYGELEKQKKNWRDEVLAANPDISGRAKLLMQEKMDRAEYNLNDRQATQYGVQWETWNQKQGKATTYLNKQKVFDAATTIDLKRPETLNDVGILLDKTNKDIIDNYGPGAYITDSTGKTNLNPEVKQRMLEATSDALKDTITVFNDTGRTDEAKELTKRFGDMIDLDTKGKLTTATKESEIHKRAVIAVDDALRRYPRDVKAQEIAIDKITDPVVKDKAITVLGSRLAKQKQVKEANDRNIIEDASAYVRSGNWASLDEMREDKTYKNYANKLTDQKDRDALEQIAFSPKFSNSDTEYKIGNMIEENTLKDLSKPDLDRALVGANEAFRKSTIKKWTDARTTTGAEKSKTQAIMWKTLNEQLSLYTEELGLDEDPDNLSKEVIGQWRAKLDKDTENMPANAKYYNDPDLARKYVVDLFTDARKNALYDPNAKAARQAKFKFQSATGERKVVKPVVELPPFTNETKLKWIRKFNTEAKKAGEEPFNSKIHDLNDFRRKHGDKL